MVGTGEHVSHNCLGGCNDCAYVDLAERDPADTGDGQPPDGSLSHYREIGLPCHVISAGFAAAGTCGTPSGHYICEV